MGLTSTFMNTFPTGRLAFSIAVHVNTTFTTLCEVPWILEFEALTTATTRVVYHMTNVLAVRC